MQKLEIKCLISGCQCSPATDQGRTICIEPDDDGWICEACYQFLITGRGTASSAYKLAHSAEYHERLDPDVDFRELPEMNNPAESMDIHELLCSNAERHQATQSMLRDRDPDPHAVFQAAEAMLALQEHFEENGVSRLSYDDLIRSKGMDKVREGKLEFDNFTLDEKVILKRNGVLIYHADTYERDACRCANFACEERWHKVTRYWGQNRSEYVSHIKRLDDHEARMNLEETFAPPPWENWMA